MDIIHIQTSGGLGSFIAGIFGVIGGKIIQKPVIITFHYSRTEFFLENYTRLFYFVLKNSQKMILVSYKQIDAITKKFPDTGKKLSYIPNGFNEDIFFLREQAICRTLL